MVFASLSHSASATVKKRRGFTLVELLVVTGIMTVLSSIVLANNAKFGGVISLRNLAYDIALTIREAQTYGISVRKFGSGSGSFGFGYGIHVRTASPTSYIMFADVDGEGHYGGCETEATCELAQSFTIGRGFSISDLCVTPSGGTETCGQEKLDIVFRRPEPDAEIRTNDGQTLNERGRIEIISPRGDIASVLVEATGQISIVQ